MAIQELSREEVSAVSGGGLLDGVLGIVGKLVTTPLVANLLGAVGKITSGLLGALRL